MLQKRSAKYVALNGVSVAIAAAVIAHAAPAHSDNGPACVQAMVRSIDVVSSVHGLAVRDCARRAAFGRLPVGGDFKACLTRKDEGPLRRHAFDGTLQRETQYCVPAPAFGFVSGDKVNRAADDWELQVGSDVFGPVMGDALVTLSADAVVSGCQLAAMRGYDRLRTAALDGLLLCLQQHVASWDAAGVSGCIDGSDNDSLVKLERAESIFESEIATGCSKASLPVAFPGICTGAASAQAAATCMVAPVRCRTCRMSEAALGVVADCETFDNGQADGSCPADTSACGNGIADPGEECDKTDVHDLTCNALGFAGGTLACTQACNLDTSGCTHCGDGVVGQDEQCDTTELAGATCASLGFEAGTLSCSDKCSFDTSTCSVCGDGVVGGAEQCDGTDFGSQTCATQGFDVGTLACTGDCQLDTAACYRCGDGRIDPGEQCDSDNLAGKSCTDLGFVAGQLGCSQDCSYDTSLCFSDCNKNAVPPADLKFGVGDSLRLFGDSITQSFHENRYHYGKILLKVLGSSYCAYANGLSVSAVGHKGSTYAHYGSYVRRLFDGASDRGRQWVMFEDFGKTVKLDHDRFERAVRDAVGVVRRIDPSAGVLLGTTPPLEECPDRPGICSYYNSVCNFVAHNDIITSHLAEELAVDTIPWHEDFCRLLWSRPSLMDLQFTIDGIHPRPSGDLGLALSILKWAGVPRQDLVLSGLESLHPDLTPAEAEQVANWIYDPTTYDCSQILEPCGQPGRECLDYITRAGL